MTPPPPTLTPDACAPRSLAAGWRHAGAAALALVCVGLVWQGGVTALSGLAGAALVLVWWLRGQVAGLPGATSADGQAEPRVSGGRVGAEVMVSQVVPVWGRQLEVTRSAAADSVGQLLENFASMSGTLDQLIQGVSRFGPELDQDLLGSALERADGPLAALLAPSTRAFAQRDAAVAELAACASALVELRQLGQQAREIGKHTRLVAFNASIEANRGNGDGGAMAVAQETRMLAERMGQVGERLGRVVGALEQALAAGRQKFEFGDTSTEELQQELALAARQSLTTLLGGVGGLAGVLQAAGELQAAGQQLREQVDAQFVHFQFGDRLSQMLNIVASDMQNFARWVGMNPYATQSDAAEWLANLEASYTMDEQRAEHHGNVHVDRGSEVEFF